MQKVIAIIPARGGSKRFPRKNIHPLNGRPLISYPIEAAKKSNLIDRIIVSTDDEEIAKTAKECGAEVPFIRPKQLGADNSPVIDTMVYTVEELERKEDYHANFTVLLQPATPLVLSEQIDRAIQLAFNKKADSVINVSKVDTINHPYNIRKIKENGTIGFWLNDLHYNNIEKPKPTFYHAANLWLTSYKTLINEHKLEGKNNYPLFVPSVYSLDIDYKEDLQLIESLLKHGQILAKN